MEETKSKHLIFTMNNGSRDFKISNKDCKYIDYDLVDRIIHSIPIDTEKHQGFYHNLIYKKVPKNLRPLNYNLFIPQYGSSNFNTSRLVWKILNRTIYRPCGAPWLRRNMRQLADADADSDTVNFLKEECGLKYVHDEETFYKVYKSSRQDFVEKVKKAKNKEKALERIYNIRSDHLGRRGVQSLSQSNAIIKKKKQEIDRLNQFAAKYAEGMGMTAREFRQQGGMKGLGSAI